MVNFEKKNKIVYAIVFDFDTDCLKANYHNDSFTNAYGDIRKFMESNNFTQQQRSVYFGNDKVTSVSCVITVQNLCREFSWFSLCVRDIRMLRIEESNDLKPALL